MTPQHNPITLPTIEDLTRCEFISSALAAARFHIEALKTVPQPLRSDIV